MSVKSRKRSRAQQQQAFLSLIKSDKGVWQILEGVNARLKVLAYDTRINQVLLPVFVQQGKLMEVVKVCKEVGTPLTREDIESIGSSCGSILPLALETYQLEAVLEVCEDDKSPIKSAFFGSDPHSIPERTLTADWDYLDAFLEHFGEEVSPEDHFRTSRAGINKFHQDIRDLEPINLRLKRKGVKTSLTAITVPDGPGKPTILEMAIAQRQIPSLMRLEIENDEPIPVETWVEALGINPGINARAQTLKDSLTDYTIWYGRSRDMANVISALISVNAVTDANEYRIDAVNAELINRALAVRPALFALQL